MTLDPIALDELSARLGLGSHELVSIVGGGGKTTTMYALAKQLSGRRIATTTTKMGHDQTCGYPLLLSPSDDELTAAFDESGTTSPIVAWKSTEGTKAVGVGPEDCDRWFDLVDHVVVEADGARRRPFKAPGPMEPVVPSRTTMLVSVIGSDALGRVIGDQCHRPMRVAALAGCQPFERLTPDRAATVLLHERGFLASRPPSARMAIVITKVDDVVAADVAELVDCLARRRAEGAEAGVAALSDIDVVTVARSDVPPILTA